MARELSTRLTIIGSLQATMPLHVGGLPNSAEEDMPLAKNGLGELYVPGTSLAGVFRAWMERHFNETAILNNLWGFQEQPKIGTKPQGSASRILVEDAKVTPPTGLSEELWDSTSIDRRWGTAAKGHKFDRTVLPKGSKIDLHLQVDLPTEEDQAKAIRAMLGHLIKALQQKQIALGGATTRGLGQVELIKSELHEIDWNQTGLLDWLENGTTAQKLDFEDLIKNDKTLSCCNPKILHLTIDWAPVGPLMTKASHDGIAVDMLPKVAGIDNDKMTLVLPGSGIKGALRTQAERIVRTVLASKLLEDDLEQINVALVDDLFGSAKKASTNTGKRACLRINTCYAKNNYTIKQWQNIENAKSSENSEPLYTALKEAKLRNIPYFEQGFHVGIDRWTGGAADGFLYSAIEPFEVEWEPIEIHLDLDRLHSKFQKPALALLLLLLRDLSANRLPLGFGVNRGYGELEVKQVSFQWEKTDETDETENQYGLDGLSLNSPISLNNLPSLQEIQTEWRDWIKYQKECQ